MMGANWIWNWPQIRSDVARARAIEPLNVSALFSEATARLASGSGSGFLGTLDTMGRSDPRSPIPPLIHVHYYSLAGMRDSTQAAWRRVPDYLRRVPLGEIAEGLAMLGLGQNADAERVFRDGESAVGHPSPMRVVALVRVGRIAEARTQFAAVGKSFVTRYFPPELIAAGAAELGDTTAMYRWLDVGQHEQSAWALYLGFWSGALGSHRQEPHFQRILKRVGLSSVTFTTGVARPVGATPP